MGIGLQIERLAAERALALQQKCAGIEDPHAFPSEPIDEAGERSVLQDGPVLRLISQHLGIDGGFYGDGHDHQIDASGPELIAKIDDRQDGIRLDARFLRAPFHPIGVKKAGPVTYSTSGR
jgi:hypothetical protein